MLLWSCGSIGWSIAYEGKAVVPYPSFADVFWLLWYPCMALGIGLLIRVRIKRFELHRWMDGVAVVLLVLAAGFAIVIQPVARETLQGATATVVDFSYPVLDLLLIGAILGVYGLLGWRPDAMWILLGLGSWRRRRRTQPLPSRRPTGCRRRSRTTSSGLSAPCSLPVPPG